MAITNTKLNALHGKDRAKKQEYPDRDGLTIVAGLSGKVSFVFRYRVNGQSKRHTIGSYPAFSLDDAREETYKLRRLVESGEDPKSKAIQNNAVRRTLEDCAEHWLVNYVAHLKPKTKVLYQAQASRYFTNKRLTPDVETARFEDWIAYFDKVATDSTRKNAGAILKTLKSMLRYCKMRGFIKRSCAFDIELKAIGEASSVGQRNLDMTEVARFWLELGRSKATPAIKICLKLLLIFGARNSEIREAHRSEFDLDKCVWLLPASRSKTGKAIRRPIPALAVALIKELDELYGKNGFLIPGANLQSCMTTHSVAKMCKRVWGKMHLQFGTDEFIVHDFRRTLSTRLSEFGVAPHVTEKMLGHEMQGVMAIYNKHDWLDDQKVAYELWCNKIQEAAQNESTLSA